MDGLQCGVAPQSYSDLRPYNTYVCSINLGDKLDSHSIAAATIDMLERAMTPCCFGILGVKRRGPTPRVDPSVRDKFFASVELLNADGASDEQFALKLVSSRIESDLATRLHNVRVRAHDKAHATRRF